MWRNTSTDTWVSFKVFGILPLTIAFTITQIPLIQRHEVRDEEDAASPSSSPSPEESAD